ncbi:NADP-dependent oxidoreductase domain-containing protein [Pholiota molesta]|nr:NADP-dependent oxidoreductase domain-containing protein [Pholiota molesta]
MTTPLQNWPIQREYDPKGMPFRRLGPSGLRVPVFSLGGWSFSRVDAWWTLKGDSVKDIVKTAFEAGINMFDTAEEYSGGKSEEELGRAIRELGLRRSDLILTTKIFWGIGRKGPNDGGLSRKHIIEGTRESLARLGVDYVDVIFAHRHDHNVPMEEIVRAFNYVIEKGWATYWGTSEWTAHEIEEAYHVATKLNLIAPIAEQCQHNMFHRNPEKEYRHLYKKYGLSTTTYSSLLAGFLTGKYNEGIPENTRFQTHSEEFNGFIKTLDTPEGKEMILKVKELTKIAQEDLQTTMTALALAWVAKNPNTATVILGASKPEQITQNLKALEVIPKLTPEILHKIDQILSNTPAALPSHGRPMLDRYGRI